MDILAGMTDLKHAISAIEECQFDMHCIDTQVREGDCVSSPPWLIVSSWQCQQVTVRNMWPYNQALNFRPGAVTTLNLGHVSIFYQVIFPVQKQGSRPIESPPRKQRLENDAKEREKQTIVAKKPVSIGLIMQAVIGAHCKNFTGSRAYVASFIRCGSDSLDYVPRYLCSPVPMFPGTYVARYLCSPVGLPIYVPRFAVNDSTVISSTPPRLIFLSLQIDMIIAVFCPGFQ